ncbi:peptide/nickel transport system permease protein [Frondihabitans sp. PhB188]|uniref:ABC transporter permease n=1 Tax=Frondihabitans sp. PhB188 TaxID=2485200 RepID=UPI000F492EE5|nr:ABC transporter permease [Frondihabitans sp. PhB188]ROQ39700.1 peptide/nickel transport system permease protein [Frondihabitans sp. PhB188]
MTTATLPLTAARAERRKYSAKLPRRRIDFLLLLPSLLIVLLAIVGPFLTPYSATTISGAVSSAPSMAHLFGTDSVGLDVFSRVIGAARYNLVIAVATTLLCTVIGVVFGLGIGWFESARGAAGLVARGTTRLFDLLQAVPAILLGLVIVSFFGASVISLTVGMAIILAPIQMRLVRIEVLRVRKEAYLDAARMAGQNELKLLARHVLPNSIWVALENMSFLFATSILLTAALGFVGVGLRPPTPEWGSMISSATNDALTGRWWSAAFPSIAMMITVWAFSNASHALFGRIAPKKLAAAAASSSPVVPSSEAAAEAR